MTVERISARECIPYDQYEGAQFSIVDYTIESLRQQVQELTAGKHVRQRLIYITYEEVAGFADPEGQAA